MSKIVTIVDHIGRTVIGSVKEQNESTITIDNPVIIHVQPNPQTGQLQVQSFPYMFMEFLSPSSRDKNYWTFNKQNIVISEVELDERIISQYNNINNPQLPEGNSEPQVVKLFDEE